jgi:hypothetical protein
VTEETREKFLNKQNDTAPVIDTLALAWTMSYDAYM